ncbi:hypothetical protein K1719_001930 [Acacia pycnantha]|nr:hypothetical protein K1719_001930 [Acacia pycnantha]
MISWEEWNSIDMDAFPKLRTLRFHDCPKLIGNLPRQLLSLVNLEIERCPLLASSIPNCQYLYRLVIKGCPELEPFSITLPLRLQRLEIRECDKLLSCLTELHHLPTITQLCIYFRSVTRHCKGLRHLTSQELQDLDSPDIEKIEGEIMPPSLQRLHICDYGFLLEQCRDNDGDIRPEFSYFPR